MAANNPWLRLWVDMPNDPKWRTVARISGEPLALVIAVAIHMLVDASRNVTRGHTTVTQEDLASALDVTEQQTANILAAMEGRFVTNGVLQGWEKRQPKREDFGDENMGTKSASQRKKDQREREKSGVVGAPKEPVSQQCHAMSRNVTLDKDKEEDKDKEYTQSDVSRNVTHVTNAGAVCVVLKSEGIPAVNPGHPELLAMLAKGADVGLFSGAAKLAVSKGKPEFAYVLGIVKRQMESAAAIAATSMAAPPPSASITVPGRPGVDPALAKAISDSLTNINGPSPDVRAKMAELTKRGAPA